MFLKYVELEKSQDEFVEKISILVFAGQAKAELTQNNKPSERVSGVRERVTVRYFKCSALREGLEKHLFLKMLFSTCKRFISLHIKS